MRTGLAAAALIICISTGYMARSRMKDRADKLNALCAEIRTLGDIFKPASNSCTD